MSEQPTMSVEQLTSEMKRYKKSARDWQKEAKNFATSADYWRERLEKALVLLDNICSAPSSDHPSAQQEAWIAEARKFLQEAA